MLVSMPSDPCSVLSGKGIEDHQTEMHKLKQQYCTEGKGAI